MFGHQNGGDALLTLDGKENVVKVSLQIHTKLFNSSS